MMAEHDIAFTAPHWAATDAGLAILRAGGTATEAMVTAAAVISVVYPHMNSIGGDGFWLVHEAGADTPVAIDACGRAPADVQRYTTLQSIEPRGGDACITGAGTVAGWQAALARDVYATRPLSELLSPAIRYAEDGIEVTASMVKAIKKVLAEDHVPESFIRLYAPNNSPLKEGQIFRNPALAQTFKTLAANGLDDFYRGSVAEKISTTLAAVGSPISPADLSRTEAGIVQPLQLKLSVGTGFNLPAPTQGVHSLQILGQVDRLKHTAKTDADWVHLIVEATKQSFADRPFILADPDHVPVGYHQALADETLDKKAAGIDMQNAEPWPFTPEHGDTVWMGARDSQGQLVSFIQSIYWEFGAAVVIEDAGFVWNNRGISFSLDDDDINGIGPGKKPRHTLNPAMALMNDGSRLSYGTMGGEGQPQTQAALFSRFVWQQQSLASAIAQGRWLLGRTWGDNSNDLKVEADLAASVGDDLTARGHQWQTVPAVNEMMGHAGAIWDDGREVIAATDPRSDGKAIVEK